MKQEKQFKLRLEGRTLAVIDWANVYGWTNKLKWEVCPQKLLNFLKSYSNIFDIRFYFGVEKGNKKSEDFQKEIQKIGFNLISKEVKWVPISPNFSSWKDKENIISTNDFKDSDGHPVFQEVIKFRNELHDLIKKGKFVRRKCDFDVEITKDILTNIENFDTLILFSGDGDYKAIIEYLLDNKKGAVVVHPFGLRGREYNDLLGRETNRPYLCLVEKLTDYLK
ncbi:NYN domain-containing protein [Candidatus Parcubacteria bacterium]|nr:NYN domain-containing protein [Candidatus Parcubacteria bacterium]